MCAPFVLQRELDEFCKETPLSHVSVIAAQRTPFKENRKIENPMLRARVLGLFAFINVPHSALEILISKS